MTLLIIVLLAPALARADRFEPADEIVVATNVYNVHYHYSPEHLAYSPLINAEWRRHSGWIVGGALFLNSFGQFTQFGYAGYLWNFGPGDSGFYGKIVGGVLHGYTGKYANKVPFNHGGFSPGVIPTLGYRFGHLRIDTQIEWNVGLALTVGWAFH